VSDHDAAALPPSSCPFILALCSAPLLGEALARELEDIAVVRSFPAGRCDVLGLVAHANPDAVFVDRAEDAELLRHLDVPVVHALLAEGKVRSLRAEGWREFDNPEDSVSAIRNVILGDLYAVAAHRRRTSRAEELEHGGTAAGL
jgi:hypothetical protein